MKVLFTIGALLMTLLGVAWLASPASSLSSWGVPAEPGAVYLGRRYGVLLLGYAVLLWCARGVESAAAGRAILLANAVVNGAMMLASIAGAMTRVVAPSVWSAAVVEGVLAAAFSYYYVKAG